MSPAQQVPPADLRSFAGTLDPPADAPCKTGWCPGLGEPTKTVPRAALLLVLTIAAASACSTPSDQPSASGSAKTPTVTSQASMTTGAATTTAPTSRPATTPASPSGALVPADAQQPAAGICGADPGTVVTIDINPDTPAPRCVVVQANQVLRVVNTTNTFGMAGKPTVATFAACPPRLLQIGQATTFDRPLGQYLAVGDHVVHISFYADSGAEVWLK
jgi:hypothetical protein